MSRHQRYLRAARAAVSAAETVGELRDGYTQQKHDQMIRAADKMVTALKSLQSGMKQLKALEAELKGNDPFSLRTDIYYLLQAPVESALTKAQAAGSSSYAKAKQKF